MLFLWKYMQLCFNLRLIFYICNNKLIGGAWNIGRFGQKFVNHWCTSPVFLSSNSCVSVYKYNYEFVNEFVYFHSVTVRFAHVKCYSTDYSDCVCWWLLLDEACWLCCNGIFYVSHMLCKVEWFSTSFNNRVV